MTKDVWVTISGRQFAAGDNEAQEPVEVTYAGTYYKKNGKHYVIYDEVTDGDSGVTKNTLKLQQDSLELVRRGASSVHMVFQQGKKNMASYRVPFGSLALGIDTHTVAVTESEHDIRADICYELEMNDEKMADCRLDIVIRSEKPDDLQQAQA